jgi:uncharacterized membrane protein
MQAKLRRYFLTGLGFLLPLSIAWIFLKALFYIVSGFAAPSLRPLFAWLFPAADVEILVRVVSILVTLGVVVLAGFAISEIFGHAVVERFDAWFKKFPGIGEIHSAVKKLASMVLSEEGFEKRFRSVVLAEWPYPGSYAMGLVTAEYFRQAKEDTGKELIVVFIPTPPNPINGILAMLPKERVTPLNMRVDEAIRVIFSIGLAA